MSLRATLVALGCVAACSPDPAPEYVYVPADSYAISVQIAVPAEGRVGEWLPLSAQRRSGPWKRVKRSEAPAGFTPFERPPPEAEAEVADNLRWMTEPGGARFDLPDGTSHRRQVKFDQPGTYQVWAHSAYPTDAKSNVLTVRVK
jgi:hypothetical protein